MQAGRVRQVAVRRALGNNPGALWFRRSLRGSAARIASFTIALFLEYAEADEWKR